MGNLYGILIAIGALIVAVLTYRAGRQGTKDANIIQRASVHEAKRQNDLEEFDITVNTLRGNLKDAQQESTDLRADLETARSEMASLNTKAAQLDARLTTALANVQIQTDFIEEHVPVEINRPVLRKVPFNAR